MFKAIAKIIFILFLTFLPQGVVIWDNCLVKQIVWYNGLTFALLISAIYSLWTPSLVSVTFNKDAHEIHKVIVLIGTFTVTGLMLYYIQYNSIEFNNGISNTLLILFALAIISLFLCLKNEEDIMSKINDKQKKDIDTMGQKLDSIIQKG